MSCLMPTYPGILCLQENMRLHQQTKKKEEEQLPITFQDAEKISS